jgi:CRP/FNR family transcriptional regulator, polysaccharide utilization system transcription regulator
MAIVEQKHNCLSCELRLDMFNYLNPEELDLVNKNRIYVKYKAGEILFKQGTPLTHVACLTSGMAKIYIEGLNERNLILKFAKPSEFIGGPGMGVDNIHHFSVSALEDTSCCLINAVTIKELIETNSIFALQLLKKNNIQSMSNFEKFISLTQKQMPGRIADALLYLSNEVYQASSFVTNISRQDLADLTAMTKESAIRILKDFKDNKYINAEGARFDILNMETLKHISRIG